MFTAIRRNIKEVPIMKKKVYKVFVNGKVFATFTSRSLAERTANSAQNHYGLVAEVRESIEEVRENFERI